MVTTRFLLIAFAALLAGCAHAAPTGLAPRALAPAAASLGQGLGFDLDRARAQQRLPHERAVAPLAGKLPAAVDNRKYCTAVANQGRLNACTSFALGRGLREYNQGRNGERATALSPLWLYYQQRVHMGADYVPRDSGSTLSEAAWVMLNLGCATESAWPYQAPQFAVAPPAEADESAKRWRLRRPQWLSGFDEAKPFLANGQAVAFGFKCYESVKTVGADGVMPMPKPATERLLGGHAVLAVGYDDARQAVICRNSWGAAYGDKGYFDMPYAFIRDGSMTMDFWTADG